MPESEILQAIDQAAEALSKVLSGLSSETDIFGLRKAMLTETEVKEISAARAALWDASAAVGERVDKEQVKRD